VYTLLGADGRPYASENRGALGGNSKLRIYGQLDCWSARNALGKGYEKIRVFFADEETAIAAGYRPCGHCMRAQYREWRNRQPGSPKVTTGTGSPPGT
jgi:methylphosphotriester-DNA--protein-cysteine methyltransferase